MLTAWYEGAAVSVSGTGFLQQKSEKIQVTDIMKRVAKFKW